MKSTDFREVKDPTERVPVFFDFTDELEKGDGGSPTSTISSIKVGYPTASVDHTEPGATQDITPAALLDGPASIYTGAKKVLQWVKGGLNGNFYELRCLIVASDGRELIGVGILPVKTK